MIRVSAVLESPLSHGAFGVDAGNAMLIRRMPIVGIPGAPMVPVVSGNALRGVMRRIVMRDLFEATELDRTSMHPRDWDRLYGALANGGHLDQASQNRVDPEAVRELRRSLPPLSTFGAALYSRLMPGRFLSGFLWPCCRETFAAGLCSHDAGGVSSEELVTEVSHARHVDREWQDPEQSGVTPMPVTIESLGVGCVLEGSLVTIGRDPIEHGVVAYALDRITHLGGKSGSGFGRVRITHDGDAAPYIAWLAEHATQAREALLALARTL